MRNMGQVGGNEQETGNQLAALRDSAVERGLGVVTEYVLDGESAWTGKHRGQLRQILDDARGFSSRLRNAS